ncbi:hypothetical protein PsorP6_005042 [Peronosclerospora sorghi]|uniref:Uncharacterized protein n=1 Tax=Peronosclerospora sorghi TaxID=230839 RepID=A0ACC0W6I3_9STRA|nr:hypothetical protein PsorP6_005042 [Peronosclerospora sorghi]
MASSSVQIETTACPAFNVTFATALLFNLEDVRADCAAGLAAHASLVTLLQNRVNLERTYAQELTKMVRTSHLHGMMEHGTMQTATASLRAQYLNTSVQHQQLAKNLEEDVLKPIELLYEQNSKRAHRLTHRISKAKKEVKVQEDAYRKEYSVFDKSFRDASASFSTAMDTGISSTLLNDQYHLGLSNIDKEEKMEEWHGTSSPSHRSDKKPSAAAALKKINNSKLVNWLLSSDTHRKEDLTTSTVKLMETAEKARRKCQHSWQAVKNQRVTFYRVIQAVLADYQQIAEDRISAITTNLRKHVVFASSTLANEQVYLAIYDWQVTALKFETIDVQRDIHDFILTTRQNNGLGCLAVQDWCSETTLALPLSPFSKFCRPLRNTRLEIRDLSSKKIPFDFDGNQELLSEVLGTYHAKILSGRQHECEGNDQEPLYRDGDL